MKKCIFWDDEDNKFLTWDEVEFEKLKNEEVMVWKQIDPISKECRLFESFDDTELKDINGKSIYANSSIFEFDYLVDIENEIFQKRIGVFYFEKTFLAYHISFLTGTNRKGGNADKYNAFGMKNFKIIDTIQENKLGLIK